VDSRCKVGGLEPGNVRKPLECFNQATQKKTVQKRLTQYFEELWDSLRTSHDLTDRTKKGIISKAFTSM